MRHLALDYHFEANKIMCFRSSVIEREPEAAECVCLSDFSSDDNKLPKTRTHLSVICTLLTLCIRHDGGGGNYTTV